MQPSGWSDVRKRKYGRLSESASQHQEPADILELASAFCMAQRGPVLLRHRGNFKKCWFATVF